MTRGSVGRLPRHLTFFYYSLVIDIVIEVAKVVNTLGVCVVPQYICDCGCKLTREDIPGLLERTRDTWGRKAPYRTVRDQMRGIPYVPGPPEVGETQPEVDIP